jgi:outer membrane protein OmpA-like peptidoglycan-associated protein
MNRLLLALLMVAACFVPAHAADSCASQSQCILPAEPGKTAPTSRVLLRADRATPPSVEYRRPDEVVTLGMPDTTETAPATREVPVVENRREPVPTVLPQFSSGLDDLGQRERQALAPMIERLQGKMNLRLRVTGHADQQRMTPETKRRFGDNVGLSKARAQVVVDFLKTQPGMKNTVIEAHGKGDSEPLVQCDPKRAYAGNVPDMNAFKACLAPNRRVVIEIWYDQPAGVKTEIVHDTLPAQPVPTGGLCQHQRGGDAGLPFRVSVDGEPVLLNDVPNTADVTRCVDVALEKADIQVRFDGFETTPVLNVTAWPDGAARGGTVRFTPYSNYAAFIRKAELRIFAATESTLKTPLTVIELDPKTGTAVEWLVADTAGLDAVQYVLRVYDDQGRFDETTPKRLRLLDKQRPLGDEQAREREDLIGYGENHRGLKNIPVQGGAVTVNGEKLAPGSRVQVFGRAVPVDANGKFAVRQILPAGNHVVSVPSSTAISIFRWMTGSMLRSPISPLVRTTSRARRSS